MARKHAGSAFVLIRPSGQALSIGIFPYVLKLLQSPTPELREVSLFLSCLPINHEREPCPFAWEMSTGFGLHLVQDYGVRPRMS